MNSLALNEQYYCKNSTFVNYQYFLLASAFCRFAVNSVLQYCSRQKCERMGQHHCHIGDFILHKTVKYLCILRLAGTDSEPIKYRHLAKLFDQKNGINKQRAQLSCIDIFKTQSKLSSLHKVRLTPGKLVFTYNFMKWQSNLR